MCKRRKITHDYLTRQEHETVSRSRSLTHPLLGRLSLRSQLGEAFQRPSTRNPPQDLAAYYAASLSEHAIYGSCATVPGFVVDGTNGTIIFARSHDGSSNDTLHCLRPDRPGQYPSIAHIFEVMPDSFVDMSISAQSKKLFYASSGPRGTRLVLLDVPRSGDDPHSSVVNKVWNFNKETVWQIAASPSGESFAVASTSGLSLYRMSSSQMTVAMWVNLQQPTSCEFMSAAFGRDDRTVMAGERSGAVIFFDARTQDSVARLRHEDAVSAISSVDDNRIIVRGLQHVRDALSFVISHGIGADSCTVIERLSDNRSR